MRSAPSWTVDRGGSASPMSTSWPAVGASGATPSCRLSDLDVPVPSRPSWVRGFDLSEFQLGVADADLGAPPPTMDGSEAGYRLRPRYLARRPDAAARTRWPHSSSVIIGMHTGGGQAAERLRRPPGPRQLRIRGARPSDSDVRLASPSRLQAAERLRRDADRRRHLRAPGRLGVGRARATRPSGRAPSPARRRKCRRSRTRTSR